MSHHIIHITKLIHYISCYHNIYVDAQFCPGYFVYFHFWASGPCVTSFEFGPRNLSFSFYLFCQFFKSLCASYLFHVNCRFMFNCYLCLNVLSSNYCCFVLFHVSRVNFLFTSSVILF